MSAEQQDQKLTPEEEKKIVKIQAVGRRKLAQRQVMEQQQRRNEERDNRDKVRSEEIEMPIDDLEVSKAAAESDTARSADALRHPTHPFKLADPSKFKVEDEDKVAGGMQRVYRRMLQSRSWW